MPDVPTVPVFQSRVIPAVFISERFFGPDGARECGFLPFSHEGLLLTQLLRLF